MVIKSQAKRVWNRWNRVKATPIARALEFKHFMTPALDYINCGDIKCLEGLSNKDLFLISKKVWKSWVQQGKKRAGLACYCDTPNSPFWGGKESNAWKYFTFNSDKPVDLIQFFREQDTINWHNYYQDIAREIVSAWKGHWNYEEYNEEEMEKTLDGCFVLAEMICEEARNYKKGR